MGDKIAERYRLRIYWQKYIGKNILAKIYWQKYIGKNILAKIYWQKYIGKNILAKYVKLNFLIYPTSIKHIFQHDD